MVKKRTKAATRKVTKPETIFEPEIVAELEEEVELELAAGEETGMITASSDTDEDPDMLVLEENAQINPDHNQDDILKTEALLDTTAENEETQAPASDEVSEATPDQEEGAEHEEQEHDLMPEETDAEAEIELDNTDELSPEQEDAPSEMAESEIQISLLAKNTSEGMPAFIDKLLENRCNDLVIDGGDVERVDTNFVEALLAAQKLWSSDGYSMTFSNVSNALEDNLNLLGIPLSKLEVRETAK